MGVKKMKAIIVAGGRGERLRPLTDTIPKPMIDIGGKPILEHVVQLFKRHGVTDIIIALCYLPKQIQNYFGDGKKFGVHIAYTIEDEPMGTAGAIHLAREYIHNTFIVTYADILRELDINGIVREHKKSHAFATLHVYKRFGKDPKSKIIFDRNKRIKQFVERPKETDDSFVWANGSFYIFEPEIFSYIPQNKPSDFGKDIFPKLLSVGRSLFAYPTDGYFMDIGNLEKLNMARWSEEAGGRR